MRGRRRHMDLGRVTEPHSGPGEKSRFACMASCGFDASVAESMHAHRTGAIIMAHYVPVTVRMLCDYTYPALSVMLDGRPWDRKVHHVFISNTRSYGGPFRVATKAEYDDGLFDVVMLEYGGSRWLLAYMLSLVVRAQFWLPGVKMVRARRVRVSSDSPAPYQLDGDYVGHTPFAVELEAGALAVMTARTRRNDGHT